MNTFIAGILTFLLSIFPSCGILQSLAYPGTSTIRNNIITAIEERDATSLEAMMCQYVKKNVPNLKNEIEKMLNIMEDEIIDFRWSSTGGLDSSANGQISYSGYLLTCTTALNSYTFALAWMKVNTRAPDEVGLRSLQLLDSENNILCSIYVPSQYF